MRPQAKSLLSAVLAGSAGAAVVTTTATTRADVDLWGHVLFGSDILRGGLDSADPYSFTSDRAWLNHEWLSEVAFALAWQVGGAPGLIILKLACILTTILLLRGVWSRSGLTGRSQLLLAGLTLLGLLPRVSHVRPQLFSVVLFAGLVRVIRAVEAGSTRPMLWMVPLLALWANLHGGWIVGVGTVGVWALGEAWARRGRAGAASLPVVCAVGAAGATLMNPYGLELWAFMLETVRFGREGIEEWGPAWNSPVFVVWAAFAVLAALGLWRASRPRNPAALLLPVLLGIASLRVGRLDAFFALSVAGLLAEPLAATFDRKRRKGIEGDSLSRAWRAAAVGVGLLIGSALPAGREAFTCIGLNPERWPEPEAIAYMHQQRLLGRMVTFFDWGEYAIWHVPEGLKVSMDGRRETVYSDATVAMHLELYSGTEAGIKYLHGLNPDFVWLPRGLGAVQSIISQSWVPVFEGSRSALLASPGRAAESRLPRTVVSQRPDFRCFPGP